MVQTVTYHDGPYDISGRFEPNRAPVEFTKSALLCSCYMYTCWYGFLSSKPTYYWISVYHKYYCSILAKLGTQ